MFGTLRISTRVTHGMEDFDWLDPSCLDPDLRSRVEVYQTSITLHVDSSQAHYHPIIITTTMPNMESCNAKPT